MPTRHEQRRNYFLGPRLGPTSIRFLHLLARKLRQINENVDGYEPEGRGFESLRARHILSPLHSADCGDSLLSI